MKRDWFTIVGICLTLIIGAYLGAYFLCVQPPKLWPSPFAPVDRNPPTYKFRGRFVNGPLIQQLFAPIHSLDIKLRPSRWRGFCRGPVEVMISPPSDPYEAVRQACDFTRHRKDTENLRRARN